MTDQERIEALEAKIADLNEAVLKMIQEFNKLLLTLIADKVKEIQG